MLKINLFLISSDSTFVRTFEMTPTRVEGILNIISHQNWSIFPHSSCCKNGEFRVWRATLFQINNTHFDYNIRLDYTRMLLVLDFPTGRTQAELVARNREAQVVCLQRGCHPACYASRYRCCGGEGGSFIWSLNEEGACGRPADWRTALSPPGPGMPPNRHAGAFFTLSGHIQKHVRGPSPGFPSFQS